MENWEDDFNEIMQKKMKQYQDQLKGKSNDNNINIESEVPKKPITLTDYNFNDSLNKYPLLVVDFWAPWCGPCRMVSPIIEQLATELSDKVTFGKLNVDDNPTISNIYGIQSIPTIIIFRNGQIVDGFMGAATKAQISSKILQYV